MSGGRFITRMFLRDDGVVVDDTTDEPLPFLTTVGSAKELNAFAKSMLGEGGELFRRPAVSAADYAAADKITTDQQSASFLQKATLGPTLAEIQALTTLGSKRAWVLDQFTKKFPSKFMDKGYVLGGKDDATQSPPQNGYGSAAATDQAITGLLLQSSCPLRAKALHTLTKLFVISVPGGAFDDHGRWVSWLSWYDRLNKYVFGNWRDLIESITYSLHMSHMLTYFANEKETGVNHPDENYARELMQLFSIGLYELNIDGTYKLDGNGNRIPTYDSKDIMQVARCITGLTRWDFNEVSERYDSSGSTSRTKALSTFKFNNGQTLFADPDYRLRHYLPMYEYGAKYALGGRVDIPEGTDPETNLKMLHDALFYHPNTAPFFCKRMIQHLVTSNPSPAYVARVSSAFIDNGYGVRGDLKAVWMAILTDPEANLDGRYDSTFGRARDGFDVWANLVRSFDRKNNAGNIPLGIGSSTDAVTFNTYFGPMAPRYAPSIFGAYDPLHEPNDIKSPGVLAPEMQMWSDVQLAQAWGGMYTLLAGGEAQDTAGSQTLRSDYSMLPLTDTAANLIERLNILLLGGKMGPALRASVQSTIGSMPTSTAAEQNNRVAVALQLVISSPDYFVQL